MGLFDVFKKNDKGEGKSEFQDMERSKDAPSAEEVREAAAPQPAPQQTAPAQASRPAGSEQKTQKMMTMPAITPNKLMALNNPDIIAREDKARVLGYFIERYNTERTPRNLQSCIMNFTEAWLWVPMRMQFSVKDAEGFKMQTPDKKYVPKDPVRLVPELLKNQKGDVLYFAFTARDEIADSFMQKYVWMQMPSLSCAIFLEKHPEVTALVVNPLTKNIGLKRDFITTILKKKREETEPPKQI